MTLSRAKILIIDDDKSVQFSAPVTPQKFESVACVLEREIPGTVDDWFRRVELEPTLAKLPMSRELRISYVPKILTNVVERLRSSVPLGSNKAPSDAAKKHGRMRRRQGYTAAMLVQESRMLEVSIFQTLQDNRVVLNFSTLLDGVMIIADEVDFQLSQATESYTEEWGVDGLPSWS
jgi:hypothetical protein